jgi:hypothetical protein
MARVQVESCYSRRFFLTILKGKIFFQVIVHKKSFGHLRDFIWTMTCVPIIGYCETWDLKCILFLVLVAAGYPKLLCC